MLIEHPAIAEAAVVPSPDPVRLSVPKTFITLRQGYEEPRLALDIFRFSRELAPYKRIRRLQFAELPKTISGRSAASNCVAASSSVVTMPVNGCPANTGKRISPPN